LMDHTIDLLNPLYLDQSLSILNIAGLVVACLLKVTNL
jgi:hypothetical protein